MNINDEGEESVMDDLKDPIGSLTEKFEAFLEVLVDHSRTEWGGMNGERLSMIIDQSTHPHAHDDLYTLDEVAEIMSMSVITIRQYVRMGKLNAIKVWRNWMVPSNEIARLIYEKKHGVKIRNEDSMLVLIDATIEDEDDFYSSIYKYKFLTIDDALNISGEDYSSRKVKEFLNLFEPSPVSSVWIEIVSNIPDFFRKTGDVSFKDTTNIEKNIDLNKDVQVSARALELILNDPEELFYSEDVMKDIDKLYGDSHDKNTVLKLYKTIINLSLKIQTLESQLKDRKEYIQELECENTNVKADD